MRLHVLKKTKVMAIGLMLSAALLSGCHGAKALDAFVIPETFDESRQVEITFWAKNDSNAVQSRIYSEAIENFEKLYPNITVNLRLYSDYGRIYNDVITNISTGTTPDVCITYPDHIATYITGSNVVVPLDDLMSDEKYGLGGSGLKFDSPKRDEMVPEFLAEGIIGDTQYAIPYMRSSEACYVNETFVEKLGYTLPDTLTWDFMWKVAEAATKKDSDGTFEVNGQKVMIPVIYKSTDNMMITMLKQKDAGFTDSDGNILLFNDDAKEILETVAEHASTGAFSTFKISGYPANFLNAGQCIFAIDSTAGSTWMGSDAPLVDIDKEKLVDFKTRVMTVPQYDTSNMKMMSQGPSLCIFNKKDPQQVLASWLFVQYMLTNDVQIAYSETEGYIPVTLKAQKSPEYQEYLSMAGSDNKDHYQVKIDAVELLMDNTSSTFVTPVFNGSTSARDAAGQLIEETVKAVRRKKTVDDTFVDSLYSSVGAMYHLDQKSAFGPDGERKDFGPLPMAAKVLLTALVLAWIGIAFIASFKCNKKE